MHTIYFGFEKPRSNLLLFVVLCVGVQGTMGLKQAMSRVLLVCGVWRMSAAELYYADMMCMSSCPLVELCRRHALAIKTQPGHVLRARSVLRMGATVLLDGRNLVKRHQDSKLPTTRNSVAKGAFVPVLDHL
jgi:hypothetical protein